MTPWELVKKSEHSHQRATFAWANCVAMHGWYVAANPAGYVLEERLKLFGPGQYSPPVPELSRLFAIHNQGHGDKIRGAQAKAEGVKAGVPDMMLPVVRHLTWGNPPCPGLMIELKRLKGGVISDEQNDWAAFLQAQQYQVSFAIGWIEAANIIAAYMGSTVRVS